jgi:hypothetical protein
MYGNGGALLSFFSSVARQLPEIVVVVVGLVVVLGRKANHPKASILAALGLAVVLLTGLAGAIFYALAPSLARSPGGLASVFALAGVGFSVLRACGLGLLVAAVVADRPAR